MKNYTQNDEERFESDLDDVIDQIRVMLLEKNKAYGDSAINPIRVFSKADPLEQLKVRIDDKLSRLARGSALKDESLVDTVRDLIGYLFIYMIQHERQSAHNFNPC